MPFEMQKIKWNILQKVVKRRLNNMLLLYRLPVAFLLLAREVNCSGGMHKQIMINNDYRYILFYTYHSLIDYLD